MRSIFHYIGGKHRVANKLIKLLPEHTCYVEVFAGAANVLLAKEPSKAEVLNDINNEIINIFRCIRYHPDELSNELAFITHSRQEFLDYHDQPGLTDIQRAARHWFKMRATFGGTGSAGHRNFVFWTKRRKMRRHDFMSLISQIHERLDGVIIENDDFEKIIKRYDREYTVFFCDPPYYKGADYGVPFEFSDHQRLAELLRTIKGKFLLTINNHPDIKKLYKGFNILRAVVRYSVRRTGPQKITELVIANYPLPNRWK